MDFIRLIAAVILPPLGVFLQEGLRKRFWINVVLTLLGYIPGIIHAVYVILKYEPHRHRALPTTRTPDYYGSTGSREWGRSADYTERPSHA